MQEALSAHLMPQAEAHRDLWRMHEATMKGEGASTLDESGRNDPDMSKGEEKVAMHEASWSDRQSEKKAKKAKVPLQDSSGNATDDNDCVCHVCERRFKSPEHLLKHTFHSDLHRNNMVRLEVADRAKNEKARRDREKKLDWEVAKEHAEKDRLKRVAQEAEVWLDEVCRDHGAMKRRSECLACIQSRGSP